MVRHAVARTTTASGTGIDKPQGIMPSIITGTVTKYRGMKNIGLPRHPLCRTIVNGLGMRWTKGAHSLTVARNF